MILQHITSKDNADAILLDGFNPDLIYSGESGRGFYFFDSRAYSMRDYYMKNTLNPVVISVRPKSEILDLTDTGIKNHLTAYAIRYFNDLAMRMGDTFRKPKINDFTIYKSPYLIETFLRDFYPHIKIYATRHFGGNIPDSKQYIVRDVSAIEIIR